MVHSGQPKTICKLYCPLNDSIRLAFCSLSTLALPTWRRPYVSAGSTSIKEVAPATPPPLPWKSRWEQTIPTELVRPTLSSAYIRYWGYSTIARSLGAPRSSLEQNRIDFTTCQRAIPEVLVALVWCNIF